jgi:lipopolysaccharide biosynthesis glycosyltransferase
MYRLLAALARPSSRPAAARRARLRLASRLLRGINPAKPTPGPSSAGRIDAGYVGAWSRLAATVLRPIEANHAKLDRTAVGSAAASARRERAYARLAEALARGQALEQAVYQCVDVLASIKEWNAAWSLAEGVRGQDGGGRAAAVGHAVLVHRRRQFARLWDGMSWLGDDELARFLPVEAIDGALACGGDEAIKRARAIATRVEDLRDEQLVDLAGRFLVVEDVELAGALIAEFRRRPPADLDERRIRSAKLIEVWLEQRPKTVPPGSIPVAVIDYQTPDQVIASGDLGDYVQTLSMLGNLVRLSNVTFFGECGLGELANELKLRVRDELQVPEVTGSIHLLDVNREFSRADNLPEPTWMIAFGWHMRPLYDLHYDFPYHRNIRPLFISFHVNRLDMLTEDALAYLRRYGPVGCRDWTSVFLLISAGVDAFFTGCLTATVDAVFPRREQVYEGAGDVAAIDIPPSAISEKVANLRTFTHQRDEYRHMSLAEGVREAASVLAEHQRRLERAFTRRLHAYLPLTALGVPVAFRPPSPGDVRFPGLTGLVPDDPRLKSLQGGIRDLTSRMMARVLDGAPEEEVYAYWRELTAEQVREANAEYDADVEAVLTDFDIEAAVDGSRAARRTFGPHHLVDSGAVTDIVLCFDQHLGTQAAVLLESMIDSASGPLRLSILSRGLDEAYQKWLASAFPALPMTFLPCDHVEYGDIARIPTRITASTMDRLLVPLLLDNVDRVVYLDVDTLVLDDICDLANIDLAGHPIAARDSNVSATSEWRLAAKRLPEADALELQRRTARAQGYGHAALNAGVLVLDLDRMRRDDFTRTYLAWVERYGLHDQDVMLAYAGSDRCVLDPRWNALPVLEDVGDPAVIHWAQFGKPWEPRLTYAGDRWQAYAARLKARAGQPPGDANLI